MIAPGRPLKQRATLDPWRWGRYIVVSLGTNVLVWGLALGYLKVAKPVYTCEWSLILPGTGSGASINLQDIGSVVSAASSPYGGSSAIDPRANYAALAESPQVIDVAAHSVNLTPEKFGEPKIKLVDQTSVMAFTLTGPNPELTLKKAHALNLAMERRISQLRLDEVERRQQGFSAAIGNAKEKLERAQRELSAYKARSGIVSTDQLKGLVTVVEEVRRSQIELLVQKAKADRRLNNLSANLALDSKQATDAFLLQVDPVFQQNLKDYSESQGVLTVYRAKWGENHPLVLKERSRFQAAGQALVTRGQQLLGHPLTQTTLSRLNLSNSGNRAALFQDLVLSHAESEGLDGQVQENNRQIGLLESRLKQTAHQELVLEDLQRNMQIAEALFSSTLGKLDVGKTDIFASYPLVQTLIEPELPDSPSSPKKSFVLLGAGAASLLTTSGLTLFWLRKKKEQANEASKL